jgi:hypothetical protein
MMRALGAGERPAPAKIEARGRPQKQRPDESYEEICSDIEGGM